MKIHLFHATQGKHKMSFTILVNFGKYCCLALSDFLCNCFSKVVGRKGGGEEGREEEVGKGPGEKWISLSFLDPE